MRINSGSVNINGSLTINGQLVNGSGPDTITLRAPYLRLQTYNDGISDINSGSNDRLTIDSNGSVNINRSLTVGTNYNNIFGTQTGQIVGSNENGQIELNPSHSANRGSYINFQRRSGSNLIRDAYFGD